MGINWVFASTGDLLSVDMGAYIHYGVYAGNNLVFNCTPKKGEHLCPIHEFSDGKEITVVPVPYHLKQAASLNIFTLVSDPQPYDLLSNNCEHSVFKAYGLEPASGQVKFWATMGLLGLALYVVVRATR
jgi:hypothetical protein